MGTSIKLFSRSRTIARAYFSNCYTQFRNWRRFGHLVARCPTADLVCPLCSLNHSHSNPRCPNPTCPSSGNLKATPGCCSSSPAGCVNCGGQHTALFKDCPTWPAPSTLSRSAPYPENLCAPPVGDAMETATDNDNMSPPPSPTHSLQSAFEVETPRTRTTTIIPAPPRPAHSVGAPHPMEAPSPSPIPRPNLGSAR